MEEARKLKYGHKDDPHSCESPLVIYCFHRTRAILIKFNLASNEAESTWALLWRPRGAGGVYEMFAYRQLKRGAHLAPRRQQSPPNDYQPHCKSG